MKDPTIAFIIFLSILCLSLIFIDKKKLIVPIVISVCFLPADLPIIIASLNFYPLRFVAIFAAMRLYFFGGGNAFNFNRIDYLFIFYSIIGSIIYIIASENTFGAIIYKSGVSVDSLLIYLVLRCIIQSEDTIRLAVKSFAVAIVILLPFVIYEYVFATNLFSILGRSSIAIRHEEIRAAATFSHSILFGSFSAALIPVIWASYKSEGCKRWLLPLMCCIFFVVACSSSGPIVAATGAICLIAFFPWRENGRLLAILTAAVALTIHLIRELPLWHFLYVRITIIGSSTGYHRYLLMEAALKEFHEWWLLGYGDIGPQWHLKYWPWTHAKFTDVTNHYLLEGVRGGSITMILFIALCYQSVKSLGAYSLQVTSRESQLLWWGFTVMMITHCITFLSVAYFGQITLLLFLNIVIASYCYDKLKTIQTSNNLTTFDH